MKTYKIPAWRLFYNFSILTLATAFWVYVALGIIESYMHINYFKVIMVVGFLFCAVLWYECLMEPIEITIQDDKTVKFRCILRKVTLPFHDIKSVAIARTGNRGKISVVYNTGRINFYKYMAGWSEILNDLGIIMQANKDENSQNN